MEASLENEERRVEAGTNVDPWLKELELEGGDLMTDSLIMLNSVCQASQ